MSGRGHRKTSIAAKAPSHELQRPALSAAPDITGIDATSDEMGFLDVIAHDLGGGENQRTPDGGGGPTGTPVDDALIDAFGPEVRNLPEFATDGGRARAFGATAFTEGKQVTLGNDVSSEIDDPKSMAVIGEEVAHALAGGGSGETFLDEEGDPGESRAKAAGQAFADFASGGRRPTLAPAWGGRATVHRSSDGTGAPQSVEHQTETLEFADRMHDQEVQSVAEPRSARQLMKALRKGTENVQLSEDGRQGDEEAIWKDQTFDGSRKEMLKVFRRLLKGSDAARALLEQAFASEQEITVRPQNEVLGGSAYEASPLEGGTLNQDGTPGTPAGGSMFLELDDLRGINPSLVRGMVGDEIKSTPETTLMHELGHAVHRAHGLDNPKLGGYEDDAQEPREMSAIAHENDARHDLGLPLRAADYRPIE